MVVEFIIVFIIVLVGSFIQGTSGFGFGLLAMGLLPLLFSIMDSTLLVLALTLIVSFRILTRMYTYLEWRGLVVILAASFTGRIGSFFLCSQTLESWTL